MQEVEVYLQCISEEAGGCPTTRGTFIDDLLLLSSSVLVDHGIQPRNQLSILWRSKERKINNQPINNLKHEEQQKGKIGQG